MLILSVDTWTREGNAAVTVSYEESDIMYYSTDESNLCNRYPGQLNQYYTLIVCNRPISGQFVQLQLIINTYMNLYEIEVHGV